MKNEELRMKNEGIRMKNSFRDRVSTGFALVLATLREIFDENAYARFLLLRQIEPSRAAYAAFLRENAYRRERRARCC
jgi:hypothetical protein